ncbi:MAG: transaldolase, partial [Deltaproteobacteria bacterium]|nr:transaldolase [Deltaproteobacteria bacterium]
LSRENQEILQAIRTRVRDRFRTATTVGFGPRYLHSTGQIHKGGPNTGYYIVITSEDTEDVPIPGEPYTFAALKWAQSMGDIEALKKRGRPVLHIHLNTEADLVRLLEATSGLE